MINKNNISTFSKEQTAQLKGIAILFMIWLHLFNKMGNVNLCTNLLCIKGEPLAYLITAFTSPVGFFLFLSGYGLYISYLNGKRNNFLRIKKLYVHYWITLLIFVPIGFFVVGAHKYPGTLINILSNVTAWNTTYDGEIWFLFPYILLAISAPLLFKLLDKIKSWQVIIITAIPFYISIFLIHSHSSYLFSHQLAYMPILYFDTLFSFILGALTAKLFKYNHYKEKFNSKRKNVFLIFSLLFLLILMIFLRNMHTAVFYPFYVTLFIVIFVLINKPKWLEVFLNEMGKRSTSMWFVHTYFCYYFFHNFIYGFKYPILIFLILLVCSYLTAIIVDWANKHIVSALANTKFLS